MKKTGGQKSRDTLPLKIRFCGDIREKFDSVQANTARSRNLRRLTLRVVGLCAG